MTLSGFRFAITLPAVALAFCCLTQAFAQQQAWTSLPPSQHNVGFQVFNKYDYGRNIQPRTNFEGIENSGERALPIQLSMWYPAKETNNKKMLLQEYAYLAQEKNDFIPLTDEQKAQAFEELRFSAKYGPGIELTDDELRSIHQKPTGATKNAPIKEGSFPLIVVVSDGGPATNAMLYEHLAAKGYIVLFTPGITRDGTRQVNAPQRVLADRINNIEYMLSFARTIPSADLTRLGVIGVNFDGMSALLYQMKSGNASAVVSIDGWEGKEGSEATIRESIYFDPVSFKTPYFVVLQDEKDPRRGLALSQKIFDSILYSDRYYYVLKDMSHAYLVGSLYALSAIPENNRKAYHYLYTSITRFLDAYVKQDSEAKAFINNLATDNGLPKGLVKTEIKSAGLPPVPSPEELETMIMAGEFDKVKQIATDAIRTNPSLRFIEPSALNLYHFRFTRNNRPDFVLALRELGVIVYPGSARAFGLLGDAQVAVNQKENARKSYQRALELIDTDTTLDGERKQQLREALQQALRQP